MADRQIVVVDVETTGLDHEDHFAVEVAWWNLDTDVFGVFVPPHSWHDAMVRADLEALRVNRYVDRLADAEQDLSGAAGRELWQQLNGNTFAGCNPAFDAGFVRKMYDEVYDEDLGGMFGPPDWHHRLLDLSAYAAGVLGLPWHTLPGLGQVCALLDVEHVDPHTAFGDVTATVACFRALRQRQAVGDG
ncbi:MAG TPA: exonuclease domain-containing protein [Pseudonocardiaceae bacterium]|nr:exonuclease domain-containing protein [Pseudonocardiaceae bacterium]